MGAKIAGKDTTRAEEILNSGNDKQILKLLREETTLIVLMVRVRNQERRDAYMEAKRERDLFDNMTAQELFRGVDTE